MSGHGWRTEQADVAAIVGARHGDPFAVLGPHATPEGLAVRVFVPGAADVTVLGPDGRPVLTLERRHPDGFFEGLLPGRQTSLAYTLEARSADAAWRSHDAYAFGPVLGPLDDHLLVEGTHRELYARLGAHPMRHEGVGGVHFAVWAPEAKRVSVVGTFNL
ncbi:MAG: GlgB N-terminal domain-containing protein, partial [Acetobacteraceae bacterium]